MGDDTYKIGLIKQKEDKLRQLRTVIKSSKESLDILYIKHQFHPERLKIFELNVLAREWIEKIREYQDLKKEIEELE